MGAFFSGSISITESEVLIVKYKINNKIQDEIPSKDVPYIVSNVTCTNNAKGVWNEEEETVELETPVRQTVCIVEFGDGYTISMLTEHGEVVSPVSKVVGRIGETTFNIEEKPGYSLSDAKIVCDNGAEGSISNKVITIINIKQNNTCRVITNPIEITVTYNVNGGNILSETSKTVIYTGTYGSLPTPTRTGYKFDGWYTETSGGSQITEDTEVTKTNNHTIYARWNINSYNVTLIINGYTPTQNPLPVNYGGTATFKVNPDTTSPVESSDINCTGGMIPTLSGTTVTINNITNDTTCTLIYKYTVKIDSSTCPDKVDNYSSPCAIIAGSPGGYYEMYHWNKTAIVGTKTYKNCILKSKTMSYGGDNCKDVEFTTANNLRFYNSDVSPWRYYNDEEKWNNNAVCSVTLTCE